VKHATSTTSKETPMRQSTITSNKPLTRRTAIIPGLFVALLAVAALAASAEPAGAVTQQKLEKAGWVCIAPLPVADEQHCFRPRGFERFLGEKARAVTALVFDPSGQEFLGTEINVRGDIFHGQPCPTDPPTYEYTYLGPIFGLDYWACHRFDSDHL
jgi:hypothetical protein